MSTDTSIIIDALPPQYLFYTYCKHCQISKAEHIYPIRIVNADALNVGELALYGWDDGTAKYHHDEECRAL